MNMPFSGHAMKKNQKDRDVDAGEKSDIYY